MTSTIISNDSGRQYHLGVTGYGGVDMEIQAPRESPVRTSVGRKTPGYVVRYERPDTRTYERTGEYVGLPEALDKALETVNTQGVVWLETEDGQEILLKREDEKSVNVFPMKHPEMGYPESIGYAIRAHQYGKAKKLMSQRDRVANHRVRSVIQSLNQRLVPIDSVGRILPTEAYLIQWSPEIWEETKSGPSPLSEEDVSRYYDEMDFPVGDYIE